MPFLRLNKSDARRQLEDLVAEYQSQAAANAFEAPGSQYNEDEARGQFIDRFLAAFGWDVHNLAGQPHLVRDVVLERAGADESDVAGRPDYRLRLRGRDRLPVEAKKPSVKLATAAAAARQTRSYGWSLSLPAAVLTNMAETVVYDTTIEPDENDSAHVAVVPGCRFKVDEYVARFDELWQRLSFESVTSDSYYTLYSYQEPPRGTSPFDQSFLGQFRSWRLRLASDIAHNNPTLQEAEVGRRTQSLLNALLFLRVCEDRNIGRYEALLQSAQDEDLIETFRDADRVFNARLFHILTNTPVSPAALTAVVREMYWPRSRFAFGVLRPDILAEVYEQYLSERVEVAPDRRVALTAKPELAHAGGVTSTPGWAVSQLVEGGLTPLLTSGEAVPRDLRVLDLACGSGAFLIEVLDRIMRAEEAAGRPVGLTERAALVKKHLYGVDIDGAAVEVTKLSLLLAVLGDEVIDTQRARSILPDLSRNILVGNAVVKGDFDRIMPGAAAIPERRAAVMPLDLATAFRNRLGNGDFSLIVGNPPYVRIQVLAEYLPDQLAYFQDARSGYITPQAHGDFDLYQLFVERAIELLAPDGRLAFIIPQKFATGRAGAEARSLLGPRLERMVHFGHEQVFSGRSTYTALVFAGPPTSEPADLHFVRDLPAWRLAGQADQAELNRSSLGEEPWPIASQGRAEVFEKMERAAVAHVGDEGWVDIFVGVQTSADDIFFVVPDGDRSTDKIVTFLRDGREWQIERGILKPALRDKKLEPYGRETVPDALAIFPYEVQPPVPGRIRGTATVYDAATMAARFPKALEYLTANRAKLVARAVSPKPPDGVFWAYGRSQSLSKLSQSKLIVRVLSVVPQYVIDDEGLVIPGGGDGGPYYLMRPAAECPYSLRVMQAILSHPAADASVASRASIYRGGYVSHRKAFLEPIPVPRLSKATQDEIENAVSEMQGLIVRLRTEQDAVLHASLIGRRDALRRHVEDLVTAAYGLTAEDLDTLLSD